MEKLLLLQPNSVPFSARKGMKRESGANPEQSRCCKPHSGMAENHCQVPKPDGKVAKTRGKSEDLPIHFLKAFEEKAEKWTVFRRVLFSTFFRGFDVRI